MFQLCYTLTNELEAPIHLWYKIDLWMFHIERNQEGVFTSGTGTYNAISKIYLLQNVAEVSHFFCTNFINSSFR